MIKNNNQGLSSIMFAMVFASILSLLAVGFATLVRNDSRQTLDQTLGYRAQYAAETGVNQAIEAIKATPSEQPDCQSFNVGTDDSAKVTCVVWEKAPDAIFNDLGDEPESFKVESTGSISELYFTWEVGPSVGNSVYGGASSLPNSIQENTHIPILKATFLAPASTVEKLFYFVPTSGGGSGSYTSASGSTFAANCSGTSCSMTITDAADVQNGYLSISTIGQDAMEAKVAADVPLDGVQWGVDSTAIAQDITKRVYARVSAIGGTWSPGFVVAADEICKDIKVDGNNNSGISGDDTCVDRISP